MKYHISDLKYDLPLLLNYSRSCFFNPNSAHESKQLSTHTTSSSKVSLPCEYRSYIMSPYNLFLILHCSRSCFLKVLMCVNDFPHLSQFTCEHKKFCESLLFASHLTLLTFMLSQSTYVSERLSTHITSIRLHSHVSIGVIL